MASLISGFEYDVFISYRQKDNKYDNWVNEFVSNLRKELEATFKEDVTIYFDENLHDGLLDTHNVEKSLALKLNSIVFIPILSRTYCDPKSFAWTNEFLPFVDGSKNDSFGLTVVLANGNVASRVLPVRIHDLDPGDKQLFEKESQSVLRPVDFIFRQAGVNRPLRSKDDDLKEINHSVFYRDQINKVANAVREIILCMGPASDRNNTSAQVVLDDKLVAKSTASHRGKRPLVRLKRFLTPHNTITFTLFLLALIFGIKAFVGDQRREAEFAISHPIYSSIPLDGDLADVAGQLPCFDISPDGLNVAYSTTKGILVRSLSGLSLKLLKDTKGASVLSFSPDGQSLAFPLIGSIKIVNIFTNSINVVTQTGGAGSGIDWAADGYIYYGPGLGAGGIWRIPASGGEAEQLTTMTDSTVEVAHAWPQALPHARSIIYTALGPSGGHVDSRIMLYNLDSKKEVMVADKAMFGRYKNGYLLTATNDGNIRGRKFDLQELKTSGESSIILSDVCTSTWGGAAYYSISDQGNIIFLPRSARAVNDLLIYDRSGKQIPGDSVPKIVLDKMGHGWTGLKFSPSENMIAVNGRSFGSSDIFLLNLKSMDTERITFDTAEDEFPVWSPDEKKIAYASANTGRSRKLMLIDLQSRSSPRLIGTWPFHIHLHSWSPDGKWLSAYEFTPDKGLNALVISVDSNTVLPVANGKANESIPIFSPDGKWIAYVSDEGGRFEVYIMSFPGFENKRQISIDGGTFPRWDKSGRIIYYWQDGYLIEHPVDTGDKFVRGQPKQLFLPGALDYHVSSHGDKIYIMRRRNSRNPTLSLITNWFVENQKMEEP